MLESLSSPQCCYGHYILYQIHSSFQQRSIKIHKTITTLNLMQNFIHLLLWHMHYPHYGLLFNLQWRTSKCPTSMPFSLMAETLHVYKRLITSLGASVNGWAHSCFCRGWVDEESSSSSREYMGCLPALIFLAFLDNMRQKYLKWRNSKTTIKNIWNEEENWACPYYLHKQFNSFWMSTEN